MKKVCEFEQYGQRVRMSLPDSDDHIQKLIIQNNTFYEVEMLDDIRNKLGKDSVIIDVGANIGNHTVFFGLFCESSEVHSFEPNPYAIEILQKNVALNLLDEKVKIHPVALGASTGKGQLVKPSENNIGMTQVVKDSDGKVAISTLDDSLLANLKRCDLIKIDAEGMDLEVLRGGKGILEKFHPVIYVECATKPEFVSVAEYLQAYGYTAEQVFNATPTYLFRSSYISQQESRQDDLSVKKRAHIAFFAGDEDNFQFVKDIIEDYKNIGFDVRVIPANGLSQDEMYQIMQWSDISWFEWANGPIIHASNFPKVCKIVCRLHKYEVYSDTPKMINWSNVDHFILVSPVMLDVFKQFHFKDIEQTTDVRIIPNALDMERFNYSDKERGYNIAYIARFHAAKNPSLMLQVMHALVKKDDRYKCYIAGGVQDVTEYQYFQYMVEQMGLEKNVFYDGIIENIDQWLDDKHFVLSTSVIESQGVAIMEAMTKGLKPVIHNYFGNPEYYFGKEYIFNSVDEAVELFLQEDYEPKKYRELIKEKYDIKNTLGKIHSILGTESLLIQADEKPLITPFISIIIPTYNRERFILECVESALSQDYPNFEVLVIDDGSDDETWKILENIQDDRLKYIAKDHTGAPDTRNRGLQEAAGEYIITLGSDDVLNKGVLQRYAYILSNYPDANVVYSDLEVFDEKGTQQSITYPDYYYTNNLISLMVNSNILPDGGTLVSKSIYAQVGGYNIDFKRAHDYEFWVRAVDSIKVKHSGISAYRWRWHDANMSTNTVIMDTSYEAAIVNNVVEYRMIEELFPDLDWDNHRNNSLVSAYFSLGDIFFRWKGYSRAKDCFDKCIDINPDDSKAKNALTVINSCLENLKGEECFYEEGNEAAKEYFLKALSINPNNAEAYNNLGVFCANNGDYKQALEYLIKSYRINSNDKPTVINLGDVLHKLGQKEQSKEIYKYFLDVNPTDKDVAELLQSLEIPENHAESSVERYSDKKNKKIMVIGLNEQYGGGTVGVGNDLSEYISKQGDEVVYVLPSSFEGEVHPGAIDIEEVSEGNYIKVILHDWPDSLPNIQDHISYSLANDVIVKLLDQYKPDIVHVQHVITLGVSVVKAIKEAGYPVILSLHDYWFDCPNIMLLRSDGTPCDGGFQPEVCKQCVSNRMDVSVLDLERRHTGFIEVINRYADVVILSGESLKRHAIRRGLDENKLVTIHPSLKSIDNLYSSYQDVKRPLTDSKIIISYIGLISYEKGLHILLESFTRLDIVNQERLELRIFGKNSPQYLNQLIPLMENSRVSIQLFDTAYKHDDLINILNGTDVVVVPSVCQESYGLVVEEALAMRVPVISSNSGGLKEHFTDGQQGQLFESGNADQLATILNEVLTDPSLITKWQGNIKKVRLFKDYGQEISAIYDSLQNEPSAGNSVNNWGNNLQNATIDSLSICILSADRRDWACYFLRLESPLSHIENVKVDSGFVNKDNNWVLVEENIDNADIVIVQRFFPCQSTTGILDKIFDQGKLVIYELDDDLLSIPDTNPVYDDAMSIHRYIERVAKYSHAVIVSTDDLKEVMSQYNENVYVYNNHIDTELWMQNKNKNKNKNVNVNEKIVIAYAGTPTHEEDLKIIEPALVKISAEYKDQIEFLFIGCVTDKLRGLHNSKVLVFDANYKEYVELMQSLTIDIALAPLLLTEFNLAKSNIKWLEYSACGAVGIFSDIPSYRQSVRQYETGIVSSNDSDEWYQAIKKLLDEPVLRRTIACQARDDVASNYSIDIGAKKYKQILNNIVANKQNLLKKQYKHFSEQETGIEKSYASQDINHLDDNQKYNLWYKQRHLSEINAQIYAERMYNKWLSNPVFHIHCLYKNGNERGLQQTYESLSRQLYKGWRLTVYTDAACELKWLSGADNIEFCVNDKNAAIESVNASITNSRADWVLLVESGTVFEPNAFIEIADHINVHQDWCLIYSDHDYYKNEDSYNNPFFKPDLNLDYLYSMNYIGDAVAFKRQHIIDVGGYSIVDGFNNYDMILRLINEHGESAIGHIHKVLFHFVNNAQIYNENTHKSVLASYFSDQKLDVDIMQGYLPETLRVIYKHQEEPLVSILIPTRDMLEFLQPCVESLFEKTAYSNFELIIIDNGSDDPDVHAFYARMSKNNPENFTVVEYPFEFNFSAMNNLGVMHAQGEYVLMLNNDTVVIQAEWLSRMMTHAQRMDVGIVGSKLLFPGSGNIQHAGVVLGMDEIAGHPYINAIDLKDPGYMSRAQVDQEYSAVTAACLLARKDIYNEVGGMDDEKLKVSYNDVDFCLKVKQAGYKVIWTPYSILLHHGSVSQVETQSNAEKKFQRIIGFREEQETMIRRWKDIIVNDRCYNKNLTLADTKPQPEYSCVINWYGASKERPRIFGMPVSGGSGEYRVMAPLRSLARAGIAQVDFTYSPNHQTQRILTLSELIRTEADAILVQNFLGDSSLEALEKYKKMTDVYTTFALDDLITNIPDGNEYRKNIPVNARTRLRKGLMLCDRLIVSTEPLKDLCRNMIDDIVVIPNYLETNIWSNIQSERHAGPKPRVGWAGAQQHSDDLAFIEDVVKATAHEVDWVFFGMCPNSIRPYVSEVHGFEFDFEKYAEKLASLNLDLAVAPLMQHPFNEAKSNLRLLEYGAMGWPVICTDIFPYQNAPVKRVNNDAASWIAAIRERIYDPDAAYKEGDDLKEWVLSNHLLDQHVETWSNNLLSAELKNAYQDIWQENRKLISR